MTPTQLDYLIWILYLLAFITSGIALLCHIIIFFIEFYIKRYKINDSKKTNRLFLIKCRNIPNYNRLQL
jgi:hypothetical protein